MARAAPAQGGRRRGQGGARAAGADARGGRSERAGGEPREASARRQGLRGDDADGDEERKAEALHRGDGGEDASGDRPDAGDGAAGGTREGVRGDRRGGAARLGFEEGEKRANHIIGSPVSSRARRECSFERAVFCLLIYHFRKKYKSFDAFARLFHVASSRLRRRPDLPPFPRPVVSRVFTYSNPAITHYGSPASTSSHSWHQSASGWSPIPSGVHSGSSWSLAPKCWSSGAWEEGVLDRARLAARRDADVRRELVEDVHLAERAEAHAEALERHAHLDRHLALEVVLRVRLLEVDLRMSGSSGGRGLGRARERRPGECAGSGVDECERGGGGEAGARGVRGGGEGDIRARARGRRGAFSDETHARGRGRATSDADADADAAGRVYRPGGDARRRSWRSPRGCPAAGRRSSTRCAFA